MKWKEILIEMNIIDYFNNKALEMLIPLYKKKVDNISFQNFKKIFAINNEFDLGVNLDDNFFIKNLMKLDIINKIERNKNNKMRIYFKYDDVVQMKDKDDETNDKTDLEAKATKQAKKSIEDEKNPL